MGFLKETPTYPEFSLKPQYRLEFERREPKLVDRIHDGAYMPSTVEDTVAVLAHSVSNVGASIVKGILDGMVLWVVDPIIDTMKMMRSTEILWVWNAPDWFTGFAYLIHDSILMIGDALTANPRTFMSWFNLLRALTDPQQFLAFVINLARFIAFRNPVALIFRVMGGMIIGVAAPVFNYAISAIANLLRAVMQFVRYGVTGSAGVRVNTSGIVPNVLGRFLNPAPVALRPAVRTLIPKPRRLFG